MSKTIYAPYTKWECWILGMYKTHSGDMLACMISKSVECLSSDKCIDYMRQAAETMPVSARMNLMCDETNHRPWLGQAACLLYCGACEVAVRQAWGVLDSVQQSKANRFADIVRDEFMASRSLQPMLPGFAEAERLVQIA